MVDPLIHRFLEDPTGLEEQELDQLVVLLREDPRRAIELREQLLVSDCLSQKLAIDRQNFFAQIEQRIADFERGEEEMYDQVAELRAIAEADIDKPLREPPRSIWLKYSLAAALSLLLVGAVIGWRFAIPATRPVALIEEISGEVTIVRGSEQLKPQPGKAVSTGDQVVSTAGSTIEWKYKDGTTVRIVGDAVSHVRADGQSGAKQVTLDQGELIASVSKQERGPMIFATPHATATVRGTELRLVVGQADTQLDVIEGQVELTRSADGQMLEVVANETAIASQERIAIKLPQWPVERSRAIYLLEGHDKQQLVRNPQTGNFRDTPLEPQGVVSITKRQSLRLSGGSFTAPEAGEFVTSLIRSSGSFAVEIALVPQTAGGGGTLLTLGPTERPSVQLRQEGARLLARVAADGEKTIEMNLGEVAQGQRVHLVLSGRNGAVAGFVGGVQTADQSDVLLDTATWTSGPLTLGGGTDAEDSWRGEIVRLAIFAHFMDAEEARQEWQRFELVHPRRE